LEARDIKEGTRDIELRHAMHIDHTYMYVDTY